MARVAAADRLKPELAAARACCHLIGQTVAELVLSELAAATAGHHAAGQTVGGAHSVAQAAAADRLAPVLTVARV